MRVSIAGVAMGPGLRVLTRILRALRSTVHVRANERTAAFVALYTLKFQNPFVATMDAFRMIEAPSGQKRERLLHREKQAFHIDAEDLSRSAPQ